MTIYYRLIDSKDCHGQAVISTVQFVVIKETPKGVWIANQWMVRENWPTLVEKHKHFILHDARRKYAYPTWEEARRGYIHRKQSQIKHAAAAHDNAKERLMIAQKLTEYKPTVEGQRDLLFDQTALKPLF